MSHLLSPPPYRSPEWHEWRRSGLGASELPAVLGVDPYMGEYELALVKRGLVPAFEGNAATRWGQRIEPLALDAYEEEHGAVVRGETWGHPTWPHLWATLDGRRGDVGVEVKASDRWREPPERVRVQNVGQMGVGSLAAMDVVRVSPYGEPQVTTIERPPESELVSLLDWAEEWWALHGPDGAMPPVDGSDAARRHLESFAAPATLEGTPEMDALMASLRQARQDRAAAEQEEALLRNRLLAAMAGFDRAEGDGWRIALAAAKGRRTTDWRAVAAAYRQRLRLSDRFLDRIEEGHTTTGEPSRSFRPAWTSKEE